MAVPVPSTSCCVWNHHNLFYQILNALAFNWDTCCHLAVCLRLLPFHCWGDFHFVTYYNFLSVSEGKIFVCDNSIALWTNGDVDTQQPPCYAVFFLASFIVWAPSYHSLRKTGAPESFNKHLAQYCHLSHSNRTINKAILKQIHTF